MLAFAKVALAVSLVWGPVQTMPVDLAGDWRFETMDRGADNEPLCREVWSFGADASLTVTSGQEVTTKRYRSEVDDDGRWLVMETLTSNGLPDCMGNRTEAVPSGERRTYMMRRNSGSIVVCGPPGRTADGILFVGPTCYGELFPIR